MSHLQPSLEIGEIDLGKIIEVGGQVAFVPIPGDIGFDRVETGVLDFLEAIAPQLGRSPVVMERGGREEEILPLDLKAMAVMADALGMSEAGRGRFGRSLGEETRANH